MGVQQLMQGSTGGGGWGNIGGMWSPFANYPGLNSMAGFQSGAGPSAMDFINPSIQTAAMQNTFNQNPQQILQAYSPPAFSQFPSFYSQSMPATNSVPGWNFSQPPFNTPSNPPQPGTPGPLPPGPEDFNFPRSGYISIPGGAPANWTPEGLPTGNAGLSTYDVNGRAYLIPNLTNVGLPAFVEGQAADQYQYPQGITLNDRGVPSRKSLMQMFEGNTYYEPMKDWQERQMAINLQNIYGGQLTGGQMGVVPTTTT